MSGILFFIHFDLLLHFKQLASVGLARFSSLNFVVVAVVVVVVVVISIADFVCNAKTTFTNNLFCIKHRPLTNVDCGEHFPVCIVFSFFLVSRSVSELSYTSIRNS